jgi:pimeloyl-ACP methyl ester carboxylesterase
MKVKVCGTGPPVLLLHGLPTSGRLWDYVVPALQYEFTCIVVDLPGAGASPPLAAPGLDPQRYGQELEALRERLAIPAWHIVGHDAGALLAVHYAARWGTHLHKLVLCSPPLFPEHRIPAIFRLLRMPVLGDIIAPVGTLLLWTAVMEAGIGHRDARTRQIIQAFRQPYLGWAGARRFVRLLRWGDPRQVMGATAQLLPTITTPTLILHGTQDSAIPIRFAQRAATVLPHAE